LLELGNITKNFVRPLDTAARIARVAGADVREVVVHALDDVSVTINEREVVGLAGESGCGKSTLGASPRVSWRLLQARAYGRAAMLLRWRARRGAGSS
jgi:ABC-type glutathione transport system ATPase component